MAITYNNLYMDIRQELHRAGSRLRRSRRGSWCCFAARENAASSSSRDRAALRPAGRWRSRPARSCADHLAGEPLAYLHRRVGVLRPGPLDICRAGAHPRGDTEVLAERGDPTGCRRSSDARVLDLCARERLRGAGRRARRCTPAASSSARSPRPRCASAGRTSAVAACSAA